MKHVELYTDIKPPECKEGKPFSKEGDVYVKKTKNSFFFFENFFQSFL